MAGEDEDITIDVKLHDYLAAGAKEAAHEMEELAKQTKASGRALLLLDRRANKAADSLLKLAAAAKAANAAQGGMLTNTDQLTASMGKNIQTQKNLNKQHVNTAKKSEESSKKTQILAKSFRFLRGALMGATKGLAMLAKGLALIGAGAVIVQTAVQLMSVVGALTTLLSFASLIPVAIGGIVTAALAAKLVFKGLGDAITAAVTGKSAALEKLFKGLGPNAEKFGQALGKSLGLFKDLQKNVQGEFLKNLTMDIPRAVAGMKEVVFSGLRGIAYEFASLANNIGKYFNTDNGRRMLGSFFQAGAQSVQLLAKQIGPFLSSLGKMIDAVMPYWNRFIAAAGTGIGKFSAWLSQISGDGSLNRWFDTAIQVAKSLWTILGSVEKIISGVIKAAGGAAGGASALGAFGMALGEIAKYTNSIEGQAALSQVFAGVGQIVKALAPVLAVVVGAIGTLAPYIAQIVTNLAPGFIDFLQGFASALGIIAPVLPSVATALGAVLSALAPLLPMVGTLISVALQPLVTLIQGLAPIIQFLATTFASVFTPVLQAFANGLIAQAPMIQTFFTSLLTALQPLLPVVQQIGQLLLNGLAAALQNVLTALPAVLPLVAEFATTLGTYVVSALQQLLPYLPQLITAWLQLQQSLIPLLPVLLQLGTGFLLMITSMTPVIGVVVQIITKMFEFEAAVANNINMVISIISGVGKFFANMGAQITSTIRSIIAVAMELAAPFVNAASAIQGSIGGIAGAVSGALGAVSNLVNKAKSLSSIDINPFKFAGGPVDAGQKYTVGEIGPELYVPKVGSPQMIGTGGMESRSFGSDGFIVPSFMLGAFKSLERTMEGASGTADGGAGARELAAVAAAAAGSSQPEIHQYAVEVNIFGDVNKEVSVERAVAKALRKIEQERQERG